jgi:hypothetical protein
MFYYGSPFWVRGLGRFECIKWQVNSEGPYMSSLTVWLLPGSTQSSYNASQDHLRHVTDELKALGLLEPSRDLVDAVHLVVKGTQPERFHVWLLKSAFHAVDPQVRFVDTVDASRDRRRCVVNASVEREWPVKDKEGWQSFRQIDMFRLGADRLEVIIRCMPECEERVKPLLDLIRGCFDVDLVSSALADHIPTPGRVRALGTHGGTIDRVREARKLIEEGESKTKACRRVGIDPRTYDIYVEDIIDWEKEPPDS